MVLVTRADSSTEKVEYSGLRHSVGEFVVTLTDGSTVKVPDANVKDVPAQEEFTAPDGTAHTLPPSALSPKASDPSKTEVTVTLPNGVTTHFKQSDLKAAPIEEDPDLRLMEVELPNGQKVEVPSHDVVQLSEIASVALADGRERDVPKSALLPVLSGEAPGTVRVSLPDGEIVTVPKADVKVSKLEKKGELVQVVLPDGIYAVVRADGVHPAAPPFLLETPGGTTVTVPRRNVVFPPTILVATLDDGTTVEVPAKAVHSVAAHLRVTLPDGQVLRLPPAMVSRATEGDGVPDNLILSASPAHSFPVDAVYAAPAGRPAMPVTAVSSDGYRLVAACPPGVIPEGPGKVQVRERSGRLSTVPYYHAEVTLASRTPVGLTPYTLKPKT